MTTPADARTDEEAFAACLAGRPVPEGAQGLAAFTDAVRASATEPGRPNAALAELLATGLLVPHQEPSRGTAGRPARTSRKRPHVILTSLIVKIASGGALAKAAAGAGVVAVTLTGATAAAVVSQEDPPAVVQPEDATGTEESPEVVGGTPEVVDETPEVVEETPEVGETPEVVGEPSGVGGEPPAGDEVPDPAVDTPDGSASDDGTAPAHRANFGATVSEDARDGGVDGQEISQQAHERNARRKADRGAATAPQAPEAPPAEAPVVAPSVPEQPAPAADGTERGNGNGNGNGNGKK